MRRDVNMPLLGQYLVPIKGKGIKKKHDMLPEVKGSQNSSNIVGHTNSISGNSFKNYCDICKISFKTAATLKSHNSKKHNTSHKAKGLD